MLGAASSVTPSFAALPLDILQLILGFIPLRPRLLVAALTCTRWREAARRATTALPGHLALAAYGAACKCLPLVASLSITLPPRDFTFPTVITSLSTLTSLEVRMELRSSPDWLAGLLENNVASLTSLSAHLTQQATPFVAEHLIQARLPSLHTLSLQWYRWARVSLASVAPVTALVTAYSSQLLSLSLVCHDPALFLASPTSFPRLTRFVANNLKAGEVDAIVKAAPQLANLGTTVAGCTPPSWFPLLSHLFVPDKDAIHSCIFEQANATATLTSMSANPWKLPTPLRLVHVRSVEAIFFTHNRSPSVLEIFPNLTSLALCGTATGMAVLNALLEEYVVSTVPLRRLSITRKSTLIGSTNYRSSSLRPRSADSSACTSVLSRECVWMR